MSNDQPKRASGHARKRWKVTFRLPIVIHQHTQRPVNLGSNEFSFEVLGHDTGVALNRGYKALRELPELKGTITRDCFVSVKCLGYYSKAAEAAEAAQAVIEEGRLEGDYKSAPISSDDPDRP